MPVLQFASSPHPGAQLPTHCPPAHLPEHHLSLPLSMEKSSEARRGDVQVLRAQQPGWVLLGAVQLPVPA